MSRQINQPINQVRLTNVATVRMNKGGKRFEIACYRNKVVNYRQGLETDLSEVLQTDRIFTNVSKGQFAKTSHLEQVFGTTDEEEIAKLILEKGTLQVSDLERSQQYENTLREVATWVANNCVSRESQRPFTIPQIRHAMKQAEFAPHPSRSIKRQYLDCYKLLQEKQTLPIERAKMKLLLVYPESQETTVVQALKELDISSTVETTTTTTSEKEGQTVVLVDPSLYRDLDDLCKIVHGRLEILQQVVRQEGDVDLEHEMERKKQQQNTAANNKEKEEAQISEMMEQTLVIDSNVESADAANSLTTTNDNAEEEEYGTHDHGNNNTRQNQKKANKKSKKAKRREKEEAAERQVRIDAEKQRQEERQKTMGESQQQQTTTGNNSGDAQGQVKSCNTCGGSFPSASAYRTHFRSDWHRYNIKLKMNGVAPVSEQEFLLCDSDAFFEGM